MKTVFLFFLILSAAPVAHASGEDKSRNAARTIEGIVYFTNNSPDDYAFLVELFDARRRRVAVKWTEGRSGEFEFKGLKAAKYYLQVSGSNICLLQYEVDVRRPQPERQMVFGDADCGKAKVKGLPKPQPTPRHEQR